MQSVITKAKVLLIDDEPLIVRTLRGLLEQKGYEVDTAEDGSAALVKVEGKDYDLVISDIRMPGMNGLKAVEKIKETTGRRGVKTAFMFITGFAEEDAPETAIRLGVTDFLLKPFDLEQFINAVKKSLESQETEKVPLESGNEYNPQKRWRYSDPEFIYEKVITLKETNMEGNVYFANYFSWQGEVREALLLSHPYFREEFEKSKHIKMITHSAYQKFIQEVYFGDVVQTKMTSREIKKCSLILVFRFFNKKTGAFLAEGWQRIAFADMKTGKICAIPHHILDLALPIKEN